MLDSYRRVLSHDRALAFSATGWLARLPIAMMTLGIVVLISERTGSYAQAGQVSAAYIIGNAVVAVPHGRLADRFGQTLVLYADAVLFALTTGLLVHAVDAGWSAPWPHLFAALSGASIPQVGSLVRARWAAIVRSEQERHTAFAVEAVGDEVVFVTGPALVTFLSTVNAPDTGLLVALVVGTVGTVLLAAQRRTAPPVEPPSAGAGRPPMPWRRLLPLALAALSMGSLFGGLEVATVAVAEAAGHKSWAGGLLAAFSFGSLLAGIVAGALRTRSTDLQRVRLGIALLATTMVLLPFLGRLTVLAGVLFGIGLALAPTLIALVSLLEASVPRARLTEAMAVFQAGMSAGIAPGAYFAGVVADHIGASASYWVCAVSGAGALAAALLARPPLWTPPGKPAASPSGTTNLRP
ncbi:MAG TPA: MFS transporter [Marmoricola sp.]|jgi:predicted MFS family arabinose efflux permease|nr:MFS transporter [Marmoricola sp.]